MIGVVDAVGFTTYCEGLIAVGVGEDPPVKAMSTRINGFCVPSSAAVTMLVGAPRFSATRLGGAVTLVSGCVVPS